MSPVSTTLMSPENSLEPYALPDASPSFPTSTISSDFSFSTTLKPSVDASKWLSGEAGFTPAVTSLYHLISLALYAIFYSLYEVIFFKPK